MVVRLMFKLEMSKVKTWNNKWTGEGKFLAVVREFDAMQNASKIKKICGMKSHYYDFGDGWEAKITAVKLRSHMDAAKIKKASRGFCGYEWMVDSIIKKYEIIAPSKIKNIFVKTIQPIG